MSAGNAKWYLDARAVPLGNGLVRLVNGLVFNKHAPEGFCPWGEARCDGTCRDYAGCLLLDREAVAGRPSP